MSVDTSVIHHLLTHCGSLVRGERLIILADPSTLDIAVAFREVAEMVTSSVELLEIPCAEKHGEEPPTDIANAMQGVDLIISLCQFSLAHSEARIDAGNCGARFLSMPFYSWELLGDPAIGIDFKAQAPRVRSFTDAFSAGSAAHITTRAGTDLSIYINGRTANYCPGFVEAARDLGSPPDIESNISPHEELSEGIILVDGSITSPELGLLTTPVRLSVKEGRVVEFASENAAYVDFLENLFAGRDSKRRVLAECGVGLNPAAQLTGCMLTDEGALGCLHFGFGSNFTVGGLNKVDFHLDFVLRNASLTIDGTPLLKDGKCLI